MCECAHVYLNSNEHKRAVIQVETRDARFVADTQRRYPLHDYKRLAPLMHQLRAVKSDLELDVLREACAITKAGFTRVCRFVQPGVTETEIEAEYAHEFIRAGGSFAYWPIIASGRNACVLHYIQNDQTCRKGELLLLDVAAQYANYNSDLTRTIPVSGRFSRRQRQVYQAVLRVMRGAIKAATPGKLPKQWQKDAEALMQEELLGLGLQTGRGPKTGSGRTRVETILHARNRSPARIGRSRPDLDDSPDPTRVGVDRRAGNLCSGGRLCSPP